MKKIFILPVMALALIQCSKKNTTFLITENGIGPLKKTFTVAQIDSLYATDSIVHHDRKSNFTANNHDIEIFEKGGKHLLSLSPSNPNNKEANITIVTINDERYTTDKGIGLSSTFKDFTTHYEVSKIDRILNNINIEFKNQDFYITIAIDELPSEYKFDYSKTIEAVSIPDNAKIKNLRLDWF